MVTQHERLLYMMLHDQTEQVQVSESTALAQIVQERPNFDKAWGKRFRLTKAQSLQD